jgi:hypothetical protein
MVSTMTGCSSPDISILKEEHPLASDEPVVWPAAAAGKPKSLRGSVEE